MLRQKVCQTLTIATLPCKWMYVTPDQAYPSPKSQTFIPSENKHFFRKNIIKYYTKTYKSCLSLCCYRFSANKLLYAFYNVKFVTLFFTSKWTMVAGVPSPKREIEIWTLIAKSCVFHGPKGPYRGKRLPTIAIGQELFRLITSIGELKPEMRIRLLPDKLHFCPILETSEAGSVHGYARRRLCS